MRGGRDGIGARMDIDARANDVDADDKKPAVDVSCRKFILRCGVGNFFWTGDITSCALGLIRRDKGELF